LGRFYYLCERKMQTVLPRKTIKDKPVNEDRLTEIGTSMLLEVAMITESAVKCSAGFLSYFFISMESSGVFLYRV
jgi:hypothetical protein